MRLNVISIYYWPEATGIGPYAAATAEYFARCGEEVTAVVGLPHFPAWKLERTHGAARVEERGGVRVLRYPHYVPALHHSLTRARYELSFLRSVGPSRHLPSADVTLAIVPNLAAAYVALLRPRTCGPYGVIVQDVSSVAAAESGTPGGSATTRLARAIEGAALRRAAFVGVVAKAFVDPIVEMGVCPTRIIQVPNWTHLRAATRPREDVRRMFGWDSDTTIALHAGNMGRKQALETVIDGARAADAEGAPVEFVLMGDGNQRHQLLRYAEGVKRLRFLAPQPDDIFPDLLCAADVLLLSERRSVREMSLPSKLTSYFSAGRPIVGAVAPDGSSASELARAGAAVLVPAEDPSALLAAVMNVRRDPVLARSLGDAGRAYASTALRPDRSLRALREAVLAVAREETTS